MSVDYLFPGFCTKALTFSYDDGTIQDRRLTRIFQKYHLKATFNLNSSTFDTVQNLTHEGFSVNFDKVTENEVHDLYEPFEVATHTYTHPALPDLSDEAINEEILRDINKLETLTGKSIYGLAYPGGLYDERVISRLRDLGIRYARTVNNTTSFGLPEDFLEWNPTCHDHYEGLMALADKFLNYSGTELQLFYVWGHSFELDKNDTDRWRDLETFCSLMGDREDIWYCTNYELCSYINAVRSVSSNGELKNTTGQDIYVVMDNQKLILNKKQKNVETQTNLYGF